MDRRSKLALIAISLLLYGSLSSVLADLTESSDTRKSVVLDPFNHKFKYLPYYEPCIRITIHYLERAGYAVDYYKDENVTLDVLKQLDNQKYDIIYINTHGFMDSEDRILIFTGEKCTPEKMKLHQQDMEERRIRCFEPEGNLKGYFYVTPSFFTLYGNDTRYNNALVFIDSCHSANNTSMAEAFLSLGAGCYVGWTSTIGIEYGVAMDGKFFRHMCIEGETVEQSIKKIESDLEMRSRRDSPRIRSEMAFFGNRTLVITRPPHKPENEGLRLWVPVTIFAIAMTVAAGVMYGFTKNRGNRKQRTDLRRHGDYDKCQQPRINLKSML